MHDVLDCGGAALLALVNVHPALLEERVRHRGCVAGRLIGAQLSSPLQSRTVVVGGRAAGFHKVRHLDAEGISIVAVREAQGVEEAVTDSNHPGHHEGRDLAACAFCVSIALHWQPWFLPKQRGPAKALLARAWSERRWARCLLA